MINKMKLPIHNNRDDASTCFTLVESNKFLRCCLQPCFWTLANFHEGSLPGDEVATRYHYVRRRL